MHVPHAHRIALEQLGTSFEQRAFVPGFRIGLGWVPSADY